MIKRLVVCVLATVLAVGGNRAYAQQEELPVDSNAVVTNSFWDNWYGQLGVDMSLLFPSHHSAKDVFPNGKCFGAGVGIGAAELTWWLSDLCFGKGSNVAVGSSGNTVDVAVRW